MILKCKYKLQYVDSYKQGNNLRIEIMKPSDRCILKLPEHWSSGAKEIEVLKTATKILSKSLK